MSDDDRITQHIELNPNRRGLAEARLKDFGVPVWALISYLPAVGGDVARVAADYEVPRAAVEAAIAYYQRHRAIIDDRIAANSATTRDALRGHHHSAPRPHRVGRS